MYSIKERVRYSETDKTGHLTLTGIVNYFQDCSNFQSEELGVGMKFLNERHHGWILSAWQIIVERYPKLCEEIEVGTWPTAFNGLYGTRNFVMNDKHGKCVAYANSIWVFMDTERKRPAKPSKEDIEKYETEPELQMEYVPRKIALPETWEEKEPFSVQKSDIDTNGHVNNSRYVQMALEVADENMAVVQIRVEYKKSALYGDKIFPKMHSEERKVTVKLCDAEDKTFAVVELTGEEK